MTYNPKRAAIERNMAKAKQRAAMKQGPIHGQLEALMISAFGDMTPTERMAKLNEMLAKGWLTDERHASLVREWGC